MSFWQAVIKEKRKLLYTTRQLSFHWISFVLCKCSQLSDSSVEILCSSLLNVHFLSAFMGIFLHNLYIVAKCLLIWFKSQKWMKWSSENYWNERSKTDPTNTQTSRKSSDSRCSSGKRRQNPSMTKKNVRKKTEQLLLWYNEQPSSLWRIYLFLTMQRSDREACCWQKDGKIPVFIMCRAEMCHLERLNGYLTAPAYFPLDVTFSCMG